jgi:hypothetical protein
MLLIPKEITNNTKFSGMVDKFELMSGVSNCCYDCYFSWYCNKCCFTWIGIDGREYKTCGNTFMKRLLHPKHGGGRYSASGTQDSEYWIYLRKFFANDMKYGLRRNSLICIKL